MSFGPRRLDRLSDRRRRSSSVSSESEVPDMTINTSTIPRIPTDKELTELEERFWKAMATRDGRRSQR